MKTSASFHLLRLDSFLIHTTNIGSEIASGILLYRLLEEEVKVKEGLISEAMFCTRGRNFLAFGDTISTFLF